MTGEKRCRGCGIVKLVEEFHTARRNRDGRKSACKTCRHTVRAAEYVTNKARSAITGAAWTAANRERRAAASAAWTAANREQKAALTAAWAASNRERKATTDAAWRQTSVGRAAKRAANARRRARLRGRACGCSSAYYVTLLAYFADGRCYVCGDTPTEFEVEHLIAIADNGWDCVSNLRFSCAPCNRSKNNRPLFAWLARRAALGRPVLPTAHHALVGTIPCLEHARRVSARMLGPA